MTTIPQRGPYEGMLQILKFNGRMYLATAVGACAALLALPILPPAGRVELLAALAPALFWTASSLAVSHYVYDCFPLYDLHWIARALAHAPRRWINIHSGLDETSGLLQTIFPDAPGEIVDLFDPRTMTEASIRQARKMSRRTVQGGSRASWGSCYLRSQKRGSGASDCCATPAISARYDALPFANGTFDAAFCLFAAHELRRHAQRVQLFREIARILAGGGELVLMEHARDWPNFLAFGPGFLHFFSQRAWRRAAAEAGLAVRCESSRTPFVRVYLLGRKP